MGGIRYELLPEEAVPDTSLALANELLTAAFGESRVQGKAWSAVARTAIGSPR